MLRFKQFISEGGNVKIYGDEQGNMSPTGAKSQKFPTAVHEAQPFDSIHRGTLQKAVPEALQHISDLVQKQHGNEVSMLGDALKQKPAEPGKEEGPPAFHTGSTRSFFDPKLSHEEYSKGIKKTGDIDVLFNVRHQDKVNATLSSLKSGQKLGNSNVTFHGLLKRGDETHLVLSHPRFPGKFQLDANFVDYDEEQKEPTEEAKFARSGGSFKDRSMGIKGVYHKMLLNAVAKIKGMKYSAKGLKDENDSPSSFGERIPKEISKKLFGNKNVDHNNIHSFSGVADLIKHHIPSERHKEIFDNFASSSSREPGGEPAVQKLKDHLFGEHRLFGKKNNAIS